jgi:hypothetical protein
LIYVNDTLVGTNQSVLTNGLLTGFDRLLGSLNVGDTVWVAIDPLKTQTDDFFINFDFSLQKLVYSTIGQGLAAPLMQSVAVPEPSTAVLFIFTVFAACPRRRKI